MSQSNKRWSIGIQIGIMLGFIGVFLAGVQLVGGGFDERGTRFWVTLVSIVFAQLLWFNVPIWMVATDARRKDSFPFQFTAVTFCTLYAAGVFVLALAVLFSDITADLLVFGHLVLLFLFATSLGVYSMAGRAIDEMDEADQQARAGHQRLVLQFQAVCDRASMIESELAGPAVAAITQLQEDMKYATGESLPGSEGADGEISTHLSQMEGHLLGLEEAADEETAQSLVEKITREAKLAKLAIDRREQLIKSLR